MTGMLAAATTDVSADPAGSPNGRVQERSLKLAGLAIALVAGVASLLIEGELELTLFMATAVISCLACFDAALDRRIDAFWPWMLASAGILAKTVPSVVSRLSDHIGPNAERFDHLGTVLLGMCVASVMFLLARPPAGAEQRNAISVIVVLTGLIGAVAGASVAFAGASGMGSVRAARILETLGWGTAAAILAGAAIAVGGSLRPPLPMLALTTGALAVAVFAARTASGAAVDLGWWALSFLLVALGSLGFPYASLGRRSGRRATLTPTVVAVLAAVLGIQATILSAGSKGTWGPGTVILPLLALGLLGLGLQLYRWGGTADVEIDEASAGVLEMLADSTVEIDEPTTLPAPVPQPTISPSPVPVSAVPQPAAPVAAAASVRSTASAFSGAIGNASPTETAPESPLPEPAQPEPAQPEPPLPPEAVSPAEPIASPAPPVPSAPPIPAAAPAPPTPAAPPEPVAPSAAATETPPVDAAAMLAATASTEALAPHLVDPATGLRSVAGLQEVLVQAFGRPRQAGEVSIVMVALRNLGAVEATHGRVVAARVTAELARRFSTRLPDAHTARFASDAFAALIDGTPVDAQTLIPRCAEVLSELLEPIQVGDAAIEIDVAASMAQCYANEDIAGFIGRANTGLERAVTAADPSLVAMP